MAATLEDLFMQTIHSASTDELISLLSLIEDQGNFKDLHKALSQLFSNQN
ncbi:hypothetical protein [Paenibacillus albiflavus]|nr:hypothetical protein [Paenibacillus albiflavus]